MKFSEGKITSYISPVYEERRSSRRNDLPKNFNLNLIDCGSGLRGVKNKLVNNIEIINAGTSNSLKLKIKFAQGKKIFYMNAKQLNSENLKPNSNEIVLDLRDIHFAENSIYTIECYQNKESITYNHFMFLSDELDRFYSEIYALLLPTVPTDIN